MYCPKCGTQLDEEFDFCPVCGYDLRKVKEKIYSKKPMSNEFRVKFPETKCTVSVVGVSEDLRKYTGKGVEINLGSLTLEDTLKVFSQLPTEYPKKDIKDLKKGKKVPVTLTLDREEGTLFVYLNPDRTYMVQGGVRKLETAFDISYNASREEVQKIIRRFYTDKNIFNEWSEQIKGLKESRRVLFYASFLDDDGVYKDICVLNDGIAIGRVDNGELIGYEFFCPYELVKEIKFKKGWLSSGVEIRYRDPEKGKTRKVEVSIGNKDEYYGLKSTLEKVIPGKVRG
ncbi:zinc ribbon domain-containing protein [Thermococcus barophilus]|uniref:Zinc-ribbon domain-containing protein n=1 Tax=Thermococcus barophilus (strain DSM 11836 / MP) TaxID=391623 RepID=F0LN16_THEBM|nr:zinc ribbon domain-containing protein [Thermococcus barophilus]ADT84145.1 hypothetical protein TERMP_01169 [Thermococcus barophilus MP]